MRKKRSDSISDDVKSFAQAGDTVQLPAGITLDETAWIGTPKTGAIPRIGVPRGLKFPKIDRNCQKI